MTTYLSFFSLIAGLIEEANTGLEQAIEASKDQPSQFTVPKIEAELKGTVVYDSDLSFVSSQVTSRNLYGLRDESLIKLTLKQKQQQ